MNRQAGTISESYRRRVTGGYCTFSCSPPKSKQAVQNEAHKYTGESSVLRLREQVVLKLDYQSYYNQRLVYSYLSYSTVECCSMDTYFRIIKNKSTKRPSKCVCTKRSLMESSVWRLFGAASEKKRTVYYAPPVVRYRYCTYIARCYSSICSHSFFDSHPSPHSH